ncbi:uncharacterized protein Z519_00611 [Cladophialophora bantiana CBS 173.52]|uniref:Uncharacterized protein n=1 Tax=Cladophialophora bantiana (strain ATCC 10958 / CBS 173.52 / CDC B-1940 / NIH 8579) TaxID=1442370 RepID=A0A0D2HZS6_CLAB1|nr:uncharacterized protein Z519_00611 [Cladophialophora bantiana CBS 173.52]KIW98948.1 hypothetical protein Z519_00611 [Cladophialophora bantiana CBS 173.52]
MDNIYDSGNKTALSELYTGFNVSDATEYPDLAYLLTGPLGSWDQSWNSQLYPLDGPGSYCDFITSRTNVTVSDTALQTMAHSLVTYANKTTTPNATDLYYPLLNLFLYVQTLYSFCSGQTAAQCVSLSTASPYQWLECTEYGSFATGYTPGTPDRPDTLPLVSRTLSLDYFLSQWRVRSVLSSPGPLDYYRPLTPLEEFLENGRPNVRAKSNGTGSEPEIVIDGGYHEWDLPGLLPNETDDKMPAGVHSAQNREIEAVKLWLQAWNQTHAV